MSKKPKRVARSINQAVGNRGRERGLGRNDAFTAYVMDRLLQRLGRSRYARDFYLKGGLLVANLVDAPHRFTRDIDLLRRRGRPSPDDLRAVFREIIAIQAPDGIRFLPGGVRAIEADHDEDGYDGVKVFIHATVERHEVEIRLDIGFGDAVVPPPSRRSLTPFLDADEPASVYAYEVNPVVAEKVETLVSKFPLVLHRLKDILDVTALADAFHFDGEALGASVAATFERRSTRADVQVLDDMREITGDRAWLTAWATMLREKAVQNPPDLRQAISRFDRFVRPVIAAIADRDALPDSWEPGGPWR